MSTYMNAHKLYICFCLKAIKYLIYCNMFHYIFAELNLFTCADITKLSPFFGVFLTPLNQLMERCGFAYAIWRKRSPLLSIETCMKTKLLWQFLKHFRALFSLSAVVADSWLVPHKHAHLPTLKHHRSAASPAPCPSRCNEIHSVSHPQFFLPQIAVLKLKNKTKPSTTELFLFLWSHFLSLFYKTCTLGTSILPWLQGLFLVFQFTILPESQPWELLLLSHRDR